jgi:hypothetical protein
LYLQLGRQSIRLRPHAWSCLWFTGRTRATQARQSEDRPKSGPLQRAFIDGALIESLQ